MTWYGLQTDEFDMAMDNKNFTWFVGDEGSVPGSSYDLQTVWQHEFGHGLGLNHSLVDGAVMEPYYEGARRTLSQNDINGVSSLYPSGAAVSGTPDVEITDPGNDSVHDSGSAINFAGAASDLEDGNLSSSIAWVSSIDGSLGTGASINNALSNGTHAITATASDADSKVVIPYRS